MRDLNPRKDMYMSKTEKNKFDQICKAFYISALSTEQGYKKFMTNLKRVQERNQSKPLAQRQLAVCRCIKRYINKNITGTKKLTFNLLIPTVSTYISNTVVFNDKIFEYAKMGGDQNFLKYVDGVTLFMLTGDIKEREDVKAALMLIQQNMLKERAAQPKVKVAPKTKAAAPKTKQTKEIER